VSIVLVTGASGFVGRQAVPALMAQGFTVHAVTRRLPSSQDSATAENLAAVHWHAVDLAHADERRALIDAVRPTHLLHLAWEARHGYFWQAAENLDWAAISLDLVRLFHAAGGQRAVFAGSCAEYDWNALADGICYERTTPCRPASFYGVAKHATHDIIQGYAARVGLSHAWGRIFFMYGPAEPASKLIPAMIRALLTATPLQLGPGTAVRDFLDVREVGAALAALLAAPVDGPVNIASGEGVTVAEIGRRLAALLERPENLLEFGARPPNANEPPRLVANVTRLHAEVGFQPKQDLTAGLADTVAWWRGQIGC